MGCKAFTPARRIVPDTPPLAETTIRRSGSFCQRSFTEPVLRLFALLRVTVEGFRMTSLASVILEPFGPERAFKGRLREGEESQLLSRIGSQVSN